MSGSRLVLPSQQPVQATGLPYAGGQLFFYLSGTNTLTPTYQDSGLTTPNTNPVSLDSAGDAGNVFLDPAIVYKVVLEDSNNNLIWTFDPVSPFAPGTTSGPVWGGTSTGSANAQIVNAPGFSGAPGQDVQFVAGLTNTGPLTINAGGNALPVYQPTAGGPVLLSGGEVVVGNTYILIPNPNLSAGSGGFQLASIATLPIAQPCGRLTLTSTQPIMLGNVSAATAILYAPYLGNQIPVWTGQAWRPVQFAETSQLLSDTTLSPAAAVAATVYDMFAWLSKGVVVVTRGPAWTSATARSAAGAISRNGGFVTNSLAITNGPAAGYGLLVGTIVTDVGGATVTWNTGGAASGGTAAFLNVYNYFNRVSIVANVSDTHAPYGSLPGTYRQAGGSTNNQINFVSAAANDAITISYSASFSVPSGASGQAGVGLDSITATSIPPFSLESETGSGTIILGGVAAGVIPGQTGQHYLAAVEAASAGSVTADILSLNQFSAVFRM